MNIYIYGLRDPRTDEIRYVGRTIDPSRRLGDHVKDAANPNKKCYLGRRSVWIRSLVQENLRPTIVLLETNPPVGAYSAAEESWIAYLRSLGCQLTNMSDRGGGCPPGTKLPKSDATRAKMSAAWKLRSPISDETRAKMSQAARNRPPRTPEQNAAQSARMKGPLHPRYGKTHTPDARKRISDARKEKGATWQGGKHSPETLERLREIARNRPPMSSETKRKIAETMRLRYAEKKAAGLSWAQKS